MERLAITARPAAKRILVVEDDEVLRELLRAVLSDSGYVVTCAGDGLEALRLLKSSAFDLVLLDV